MNDFIPPAHPRLFTQGIYHPDLFLWDAWSYIETGAINPDAINPDTEANTIHLYCLAIARTLPNGQPLIPADRNNYPFHVRHFTSTDSGRRWRDRGCFQAPGQAKADHDRRNIWSGSVTLLPDGEKLVAYTGLYEVDAQHTFVQNIALGLSKDGHRIDYLEQQPLSCPMRDRQAIVAQGYYLDTLENLGHNDGEEGGPIMTWRDPFSIVDLNGQIHLFWSAKSDPRHGVIAHGLIEKVGECYKLTKLFPPLSLPDGEDFTQAELPKVYHDSGNNRYYLVVSTCNRIYEGQSDQEVDKRIRIYHATSLRGAWQTGTGEGSTISGLEGLFGMTVLETDFEHNRLLCIAPYTDAVAPPHRLCFAAPFHVNLDTLTGYAG